MESLESLWPYLVIFIILSPLMIYRWRQRQRNMVALYQRQADKRKGSIQKGLFTMPRLNLADEDGKRILIYERKEVERIGSRRRDLYQTVMAMDLPLGDNARIFICRETSRDKDNMDVFLRDIQVGDPGFDDLFLIQGKDEVMVFNFLSPEVRDLFLQMKEKDPRIRIEKDFFEFAVEKRLSKDEEYDQFIETGMALISKVKTLYMV